MAIDIHTVPKTNKKAKIPVQYGQKYEFLCQMLIPTWWTESGFVLIEVEKCIIF